MFLSLETPVVISLIAVIAVQYAFATFCLLKLARLDIPRKQYVLWNIFIVLAFFIGGAVFLVYYFKVRGEKTLDTDELRSESGETDGGEIPTETAESGDDHPDDSAGMDEPRRENGGDTPSENAEGHEENE